MKKLTRALSLVITICLVTSCSKEEAVQNDMDHSSRCNPTISMPADFTATQNEIELGDTWWVTIGDLTNSCSKSLTLKSFEIASVRQPSDVTVLEVAQVVKDPAQDAANPMLWAWPFKKSDNFTRFENFEIQPGKTVGIAVLMELTPFDGQQGLTTLTTPDLTVTAVNSAEEIFKLPAKHTLTFTTEAIKQ
jgi:hypothetical protein